jgi:hypothetical protein
MATQISTLQNTKFKADRSLFFLMMPDSQVIEKYIKQCHFSNKVTFLLWKM